MYDQEDMGYFLHVISKPTDGFKLPLRNALRLLIALEDIKPYRKNERRIRARPFGRIDTGRSESLTTVS